MSYSYKLILRINKKQKKQLESEAKEFRFSTLSSYLRFVLLNQDIKHYVRNKIKCR